MLKSKLPQNSFSVSYLYDRTVPTDHLLRKSNQVVVFPYLLFEDKGKCFCNIYALLLA